MINANVKRGRCEVEISGIGIEVIAELTILNAHIITQLDIPEVLIPHLFENILLAVKRIKEAE